MGEAGLEYEFFGPYVPGALVVILPSVLYALYLGCNASGCLQLWPNFRLPTLPEHLKLCSWEALGMVVAWLLLVAGLHLLLPGKHAQGVQLPNGGRLVYKLNGAWLLQFSVCQSVSKIFLNCTIVSVFVIIT